MADKCKYQKLQYQVSYDNGSTWQDVTPIQVKKGNIIEYMSRDCGESETLYRWVDLEGTYICDGNNKYTRQIQEESYDNGVSWYATYPTVYKQGTFVGVDADYCCDKFIGHYTVVDTNCPRWYAWNGFKCAYVDPIKVVKCNNDSTLRSGETIYYGSSNYSLVDGEIGDSVTAIGDNAFQGFNYLSRINSNTDGFFNIPTRITSIGDYAFNGCQSLTSVTIPNGVTYIGEYAFRDCSGLTSVNIPTGVTTIHDSTFRDCVSLTSVTIPNGVTTIEKNAFISCRGLTSIVLPSSITSIGDSAFTYSNNLTSITCLSMTPPTLGTNAFASTKNSPIYVPCGSVDAYKSATYWSSYASRIEGIPPCGMPQDGKFFAIYSDSSSYLAVCDENTELTSATTRAHSTSYTAMTSAEIGNCITSIGSSAFASCMSLTSITIPSSVTSIGYAAFQNCSSLTSCTIPTSVTSINEEAFAYCTSLTSIIIPNSVTSIGLDAFYLCTSLTSITIPSGVTSIGQYAFGACYNLTSITILAATPPTLEYNNVFDSDCPIYVPCKSVDTYKSATYWSSYASRIEGIPPCGMPQDGKLITIYSDSSFYSAACDSNTTLTSGDTKPNGYEYTAMTSAEIGACITSIGNSAFSGCTSLLEVVIPSGVTSIGNEAFTYCSRITSIDIPSGVTSIGHHAFYYCTGLTSVSIPSGITSIGAWTFTNCYSLTSVTIPNSVTSIGENAFWSCNSLTSITIPSGVTSIGLTAFGSCYSLTSVTILATTPPALDNPFYNRNKDLLIYVPCSSVDTYRTDINWRGYASIILGIPPCVEPTPTPTGATKFNAIYPNGVQYFVYCDSNPELTTTTTRGGQFDYAKIRSAEIGSCITSIGNSAFSDFDSLSSITIPNSVTEIKYMAFRWCYSLTSITIPDSVTSIGDSAFYGCSGLTSVTVNATTPPALGSNAFSSTSSNLVIYVPSTSVDAYKTSWGGLANRIQAIP